MKSKASCDEMIEALFEDILVCSVSHKMRSRTDLKP